MRRASGGAVMTSTPVWLPVSTCRYRLLVLAKYDSTNNENTRHVIVLINELIAAHIMDWHGGELPANSEGVGVIEWSELWEFVRAARPEWWPPETTPVKTEKPDEAMRKRGREPKEFVRIMNAMSSDIREGRCTSDDLIAMPDKALMEKYGAKRTTVRKACNTVVAKTSSVSEILFGN